MKKFISGVIVGAVLASSAAMAVSYVAEPASFKVMVNGTEFTSDPPAMVIEGSTYLPLRAMGNALGVPVEWNAELGQAEVGNSAPVAASGEYSRNNPAPINTVQFCTKTSDWYAEDNYTVAARVLEVVRGADALAKIKTANRYNSDPPAGYEYVLAKIAFSVTDTKTDRAIDASYYDFTAFSSNNEEMPRQSVVLPEPQLTGSLYAGASTEGYIAVLVKTDDTSPKLAYGLDYNGGGGIWFALYE